MKLPIAIILAALSPGADAGAFPRRGQEVTITSVEGAEAAPEGAGPAQITVTVPDYTDEQCVEWLDAVLAADGDGSGGLSTDEFFAFFQGIEEPEHVDEYFDQFDSYADLGFTFKIVHKALACRCADLGGGEGCCTGRDAEVPLTGLTDESQEGMSPDMLRMSAEYRADICNAIAAAFGEIEDPDAPATTEAPAATTGATEPAGVTDGVAFECTDAEACNENAPSGDADSGWTSLGDCGSGTELPCPDAYDDEGQYASGAQVSVDPASLPLMEIDVVGSVVDYSSFEEGDEYYDAQAVMDNTGNNGILMEVIDAFGVLAVQTQAEMVGMMDDPTSEGKRLRGRRAQDGSMGSLAPVVVTDIPCPDSLIYAPADGLCLNFKMTILAGDSTPEGIADAVAAFEAQLVKAIDEDGELYKIVAEANPTTDIVGLGNPGGGIDYLALSDRDVDSGGGGTEEEDSSSGLSTAAIVFIALAVLCVPLLILAAVTRYRQVQDEKRRQRLADWQANNEKDLEAQDGPGADSEDPKPLPDGDEPVPGQEPVESDDESSAPSVWSDSKSEAVEGEPGFVDSEAGAGATAGSALAAMGAAGAAAAIAGSKKGKADDKAAIIQEIRVLAKETNAPKSADELLAAYAGREEELLSHLCKMKAKQLEGDKSAVKAEVAELVAKTNPGKSTEELLAAYEGREEDLKSNLEKMRSKQLKESVRNLVSETNPGKSSKELLAAYAGREEELEKNLLKMKSQKQKEEVKSLVAKTNPGKSSKELLAAYEGREDELISNLKKMEAKQAKTPARPPSPKAAIKDEIDSLVKATNPGKSTEELLSAYEGREEELANHLRKLKSSKK